MKSKDMLLIVGFIACCLMLAGCAGNYSALNKNWGYSYETARYDQIMNLDAGKDTAPVTGLDGQIAYKSYTLYRNGFTKASSSAGSDTTLSMSGAGK